VGLAYLSLLQPFFAVAASSELLQQAMAVMNF